MCGYGLSKQGLGVSFLTATLLSAKFTYDFMEDCLALPPADYASSAELHFMWVFDICWIHEWIVDYEFRLKKYGLVYTHLDGKKKYSILSRSERGATQESTQVIDLSKPVEKTESGEVKAEVTHITLPLDNNTTPVLNKE